MRFALTLSFVLLLAVAVPHYAYEPLAAGWPDPGRAARAWFYALRGFSGAVLFATVAVLAGMLAVATHARRATLLPVLLLCAWGFVEEAETGVCRLGMGIGSVPPSARWQGLCDTLTGLPWYWAGVAVLGVVGAMLAMKLREK